MRGCTTVFGMTRSHPRKRSHPYHDRVDRGPRGTKQKTPADAGVF